MAEKGTDIAKAVDILRSGGLVAIPTETVYGLAGNALNEHVVAKIFEAKKRPSFDPLIVHCSTIDQVRNYANLDNLQAQKLAQTFWPGPLTLVLPKGEKIPYLVTSGMETVAIRIPSHNLSLELLANLEFPLVAPSANPFGYVSPTTPEHVEEKLGKEINYILDGGKCELGIESTIISFENDVPKILRLGSLSLEKIQSIIGRVEIADHSSSNPTAPGMLESHYSPTTRIVLGDIESLLMDSNFQSVGVLSFHQKYKNDKISSQFILSEHQDLEEAATNLFSALRSLDKMDLKYILAELVPDKGLGRAINDRLKRAAYNK